MTDETIYILGSGAIGFPLAAYLANAGKQVIAVRTSRQDRAKSTITVTVQNGENRINVPVETISLAHLPHLEGMLVVASKSYANQTLAQELRAKAASGPLVILQNGVGVERPFLEAGFSIIYRCVLYVTSQASAEYAFSFRPVTASPIGIIAGAQAALEQCVQALNTDGLPFRIEPNIQREIWKKAIINAVFNSICPLLEVDNGIFVRDTEIANLAREVVGECIALTNRLTLNLSEDEILDQLMLISKRSEGQLISTLQDMRSGRPTEIDFLNLEIARVGAALQPALPLPRTELLGKLVAAKSIQQRSNVR
jgi:2-dehydropantoate 2-reductase